MVSREPWASTPQTMPLESLHGSSSSTARWLGSILKAYLSAGFALIKQM